MAQRDRTQGFGFMYVNIAKLLKEKAEINQTDDYAPVMTNNVRHANFNRDTKESVSKTPVNPIQGVVATEREKAVAQIKENLDRLQTLHHRLHAMLEEINKTTDKKKS